MAQAQAQAQAAMRLMTEVAPAQVVTIMRRRKVPRSLDTIAEDREQLAYNASSVRIRVLLYRLSI
ncbi:hypothetical protein U9M48_025616 [Paspalum notatum var. saurae]|uniref:Uncharacterized protein n=1 Tax=Paspalum notatum var. saurae TaxID=547442 RepID=A0AAQ3TR36_PASNO